MKPNDNFIGFLGFAPDADPTTPGVLTDTTMMIAGTRGIRSFPFAVRVDAAPGPTASNANFSAYPQGYVEGLWGGLDPVSNTGIVLCKTNRQGTPKLYALRQSSNVTASQFYGNWDDVTPAGSVLAEGPHVFTRFGNYILMAGGYPNVAAYRSRICALDTSAVAHIVTAAPAACTIISASRFAVALNYSATFGSYVDGWYCSARDNHEDWALSPTTLCAVGRLVESDGPLTAGIAVGDDIIACKYTSMYYGRFDPNSNEVWTWEKISNSAGARNQRCIVTDREGRVYMLGHDDLYLFDGAQVRGLMGGVLREWFFANTGELFGNQASSAPSAHLVFDPIKEVLFVVVEPADTSTKMMVISYCPRTKLWARSDTAYETFAVFPRRVGSWPTYPSLYAMKSSSSFGNYNTTANRYLYEFNSAQPAGGALCGFTTGDLGSDYYESELTAARVRDIVGNLDQANRICKPYYRAVLTASLTTASTVTAQADGAFNIRQNSKWHRLAFEYSGHAVVTGINLDIEKRGAR